MGAGAGAGRVTVVDAGVPEDLTLYAVRRVLEGY